LGSGVWHYFYDHCSFDNAVKLLWLRLHYMCGNAARTSKLLFYITFTVYIPPLLLWLQNTFETYLFCCRFSHRFTSAVSFLAQYTVSRFFTVQQKKPVSFYSTLALSLLLLVHHNTYHSTYSISHCPLSLSRSLFRSSLSVSLSLLFPVHTICL